MNWDALAEQIRVIATEEIIERGRAGYVVRTANRLNVSQPNLGNWLSRSAPFRNELRALIPKSKQPEPGPESEKLPSDHPEIRELERLLQAEREKSRELRRKVQHVDRDATIIEQLSQVIVDTYEPIAPVKLEMPKSKKSQEPVDAVVTLSDQHTDRVIREEGTWGLEHYDFNVYRARLYEWAKVIRSYVTRHLPNYFFDTLWVWHLGDAVNGDIHNMKLKNFWANSLVASLAAGDVQAEALLWLAEAFKRVVVVCVPGNHGRTTKQIEWEDPYDNFDYLTAKAMALRLAEYKNRLQIFTPRAWSAHVEVRGHLCHLNHGHGVTGTWGIPWYGFERREGRVQRLASFKNREVSYYFYGHYHTQLTRPSGKGKAIHAGSWYFTDEFSLNKLSVGNKPEQTMLMFSERFGRQLEVPIMLRDEEREGQLHDGKWIPPFGRELIVDEPSTPFSQMPIIR